MKKLLSGLLIFIFSINTVYALKGWDRAELNGALVYSPSGIKNNRTFQITIPVPVNLAGKNLEEWFLNAAQNRQAVLGDPLQPWIIKPEKNNALGISNTFINSEGEKMAVGYQAGTLSDGRAYIAQMIASQNIPLLMKYGTKFEKVVKEAGKFYTDNPSYKNNTETAQSKHKAEQASRSSASQEAEHSNSSEAKLPVKSTPPLKSVKSIQGLKDLRGVVVFAIQPGGLFGLTSEVIATFNDGTYTSDLKRVFAEGTAASKAAKPGLWGKWRIKSGKLQLKGSDDGKFEAPRGDWIARPGTTNMKLNGCYGNITSASSSPYGGNSTVGNASSWCFKPDGHFAHSSTGFATSSAGVMGGTSSSQQSGGQYHIDGYVARFVYDDGKEITTAFCFLNDKKSHIAINGKRYMGK